MTDQDLPALPARLQSIGEETAGAHWWLAPGPPGSLSAHGYDGQRTVVVPSLAMVVVRLGATPLTSEGVVDGFLTDLICALGELSADR
jgi:CubicO group peptidase (beta-lactamase class C family)